MALAAAALRATAKAAAATTTTATAPSTAAAVKAPKDCGHHSGCSCHMRADSPFLHRQPTADEAAAALRQWTAGGPLSHLRVRGAPLRRQSEAPPQRRAVRLSSLWGPRIGAPLTARGGMGARAALQMAAAAASTAAVVDGGNDTAFEMATSTVRFGRGVTREVGFDVLDFGARRACVVSDARVLASPAGVAVLESLRAAGVDFEVYDGVRVEPSDASFREAIGFAVRGGARGAPFDCFVAVGGGSAMDTAKAANLYSTYPPTDGDFLAYVNPPIGRGRPVPGAVKPLIAVPTTAGTGSETTGVAIFDHAATGSKTGIAHRRLKPALGIVDPENTRTTPPEVAAASGFDVLCHSLESYTALPFDRRPRPDRPLLRPAYQGANPISDHWSLKALEMTARYLPLAVENPADDDARAQMLLAATYAGIGFGNAGVHLCHGMSYPVSSQVREYRPPGYDADHAMVPHGMSVVMHAPAVFRWTADADPQRHLTAARLMGADTAAARDADAGRLLAEQLQRIMRRLRIPNGLRALGFTDADIPALVAGTLPQHRVTKLAPKPVGEKELTALFADSMTVY